jgi:hypothetical protein
MSILKYITLPHVGVYKRRWVRRIMIVVTTPQEIVRAVYGVLWGAVYWWRQPSQ